MKRQEASNRLSNRIRRPNETLGPGTSRPYYGAKTTGDKGTPIRRNTGEQELGVIANKLKVTAIPVQVTTPRKPENKPTQERVPSLLKGSRNIPKDKTIPEDTNLLRKEPSRDKILKFLPPLKKYQNNTPQVVHLNLNEVYSTNVQERKVVPSHQAVRSRDKDTLRGTIKYQEVQTSLTGNSRIRDQVPSKSCPNEREINAGNRPKPQYGIHSSKAKGKNNLPDYNYQQMKLKENQQRLPTRSSGHRVDEKSEVLEGNWQTRVKQKLNEPLNRPGPRVPDVSIITNDKSTAYKTGPANEIVSLKETAAEKSLMELRAKVAKEMEKEKLAWARRVVQTECFQPGMVPGFDSDKIDLESATITDETRSFGRSLEPKLSHNVLKVLNEAGGSKSDVVEIARRDVGSAILIEDSSGDSFEGSVPTAEHSRANPEAVTRGPKSEGFDALLNDPGSAVIEMMSSSSASCQTVASSCGLGSSVGERSEYLRRWRTGGAQAMAASPPLSLTSLPPEGEEQPPAPEEPLVEEQSIPSQDPSFLQVFAELKALAVQETEVEDQGMLDLEAYEMAGESELELREMEMIKKETSTPSTHTLGSEEKPVDDYCACEEDEKPLTVDVSIETTCPIDWQRLKFKGPRKILQDDHELDVGVIPSTPLEEEAPYPETEYLKQHFANYLPKALAEIEWFKPDDPVEYLAHWLLHKIKAEERIEEENKTRKMLEELFALREEEKRLKAVMEEQQRMEREEMARQYAMEIKRMEMAGEGDEYDPDLGRCQSQLPPIKEDPDAEEKERAGCIEKLLNVMN